MEGSSAKKRKISSSPVVKKEGPSKNMILPVEMISCYNSERIHFDGITLFGNEPPMKNFMESDRVFSSIMIENVTLEKDHNLFWEKCGKNFTELIIKKCSILTSNFILILKEFTNLTKLVILESPDFCTSLFIDIEKGNKGLFDTTAKLSSFIIDGCWCGLGSPSLSKWLSKMTKITEFEISLNKEDLFIVDCLKNWEKQLTSLRLKNKISIETTQKIYEFNFPQLQVFQFGSVETVSEGLYKSSSDSEDNLIEFVSKLPNLIEFGVGIEIGEHSLIKLSEHFSNLKILAIYNASEIYSGIRNANVLALFGRLSKLHYSGNSFSALNYFLESSNSNLTHLTFQQPYDEGDVRDYRRNYDIPFYNMNGFKNLTYLDVDDDFIDGVAIQNILKRITGLEVLRVKSKYTLSDFAFSGNGPQYPHQERFESYNINGNCRGPFYQLGRLKNLIELDIQSTDNKFTDFALDRISKLKKLRILSLINYKKVTIVGIADIIAKCQKLEQINISGCKKKIANEISSHFKKRVIKVIYEKIEEE